MDIDLRRKCVHILRRVCGLQTILPRSCILSDNISKERDIAVCPSDGFVNTWKGHQNGNRVCVKAFRTHTAEELSNAKQVRKRIPRVQMSLCDVVAAIVSRNRHLEAPLPPKCPPCTGCPPAAFPVIYRHRMDD